MSRPPGGAAQVREAERRLRAARAAEMRAAVTEYLADCATYRLVKPYHPSLKSARQLTYCRKDTYDLELLERAWEELGPLVARVEASQQDGWRENLLF